MVHLNSLTFDKGKQVIVMKYFLRNGHTITIYECLEMRLTRKLSFLLLLLWCYVYINSQPEPLHINVAYVERM